MKKASGNAAKTQSTAVPAPFWHRWAAGYSGWFGVGTTGAGPKGVFGLDVTQRSGSTAQPVTSSNVLFDIAGTDTAGQPPSTYCHQASRKPSACMNRPFLG